jgi:hypothetical protein
MKTTVIQIGNSDNKLTQEQWSEFIEEINYILYNEKLHFVGGSNNSSPYQNYCWVVEGELSDTYKKELTDCRIDYLQDSIAVTTGTTEFI